jgi:hypothetical protein
MFKLLAKLFETEKPPLPEPPVKPAEPTHENGETRIVKQVYGDGRIVYTPQVYTYYYRSYGGIYTALEWQDLVEYKDGQVRYGYYGTFANGPQPLPGPATLEDAKAIVDAWLRQQKAKKLVSTTYIKYP